METVVARPAGTGMVDPALSNCLSGAEASTQRTKHFPGKCEGWSSQPQNPHKRQAGVTVPRSPSRHKGKLAN